MRTYESVGVGIPELLLPRKSVDLTKWAVVACDQYTSQPEYWDRARQFVGDAPSTLNLIYPEVYLGEAKAEERIKSIRSKMIEYLDGRILEPHEGLVYVEREAAGKVRKGIVLCIDLENYDYRKGATSLIRATEGTILERIPPRVRIREGAKLECPHIMILIDDPENTVIGPLSANKRSLPLLYDFDLMMKSGRLAGYKVSDEALEKGVIRALDGLADSTRFAKKYGLPGNVPVLLFAMGDGNHSLATAKAIWEKTKERAADKHAVMGSPARWALVEIVNLHEAALAFEPIHRVIFAARSGRDLLNEMKSHYLGRFQYEKVISVDTMKSRVHASEPGRQRIGVIRPAELGVIEITKPPSNLAVGSLQLFLDKFMESGGAEKIDYVHGTEPVVELGRQEKNIGFYLPSMNKYDLFKTVIVDGALPRKTFSMGEAAEKRFYMECRRIG